VKKNETKDSVERKEQEGIMHKSEVKGKTINNN